MVFSNILCAVYLHGESRGGHPNVRLVMMCRPSGHFSAFIPLVQGLEKVRFPLIQGNTIHKCPLIQASKIFKLVNFSIFCQIYTKF